MNNRIHGVAFFCDDIRHEVGDRNTFVGTLPDNFEVPAVPGLIPKLGIAVRIHVPVELEPNDLNVFISVPGENRELMAAVDKGAIASTLETARAQGAGMGGFIINAVASPFHVHQAGKVLLECECGDDRFTLGSLNIVVV